MIRGDACFETHRGPRLLRIGIDAHAIGSRLGGNETYVRGLIEGLAAVESSHRFVVYFASEEAARWAVGRPQFEARILRATSSLGRLLVELPTRCALDRLDMLHVQYFAPPACPVPFVPVLHDLSFVTLPEFFSRTDRVRFWLGIPWTLRRAPRVLTISESTRRDIVERFGIPADRVDVAHLAVDHEQFAPRSSPGAPPRILKTLGIDEPFVLAVGNLQPRKNLIRLLEAYGRVRRENPDLRHRLVLVGKRAFRHAEVEERIDALGLEPSIVRTGYVSEPDLVDLYRHATVFCYPSLWEGFGLPLVEAMAAGTPVLTSDRSSMPEVVGDAAVLVNPESIESIAAGLARLLRSQSLRDELSGKGLEMARRFSWRSTARSVLASLETAAGLRPPLQALAGKSQDVSQQGG